MWGWGDISSLAQARNPPSNAFFYATRRNSPPPILGFTARKRAGIVELGICQTRVRHRSSRSADAAALDARLHSLYRSARRACRSARRSRGPLSLRSPKSVVLAQPGRDSFVAARASRRSRSDPRGGFGIRAGTRIPLCAIARARQKGREENEKAWIVEFWARFGTVGQGWNCGAEGARIEVAGDIVGTRSDGQKREPENHHPRISERRSLFDQPCLNALAPPTGHIHRFGLMSGSASSHTIGMAMPASWGRKGFVFPLPRVWSYSYGIDGADCHRFHPICLVTVRLIGFGVTAGVGGFAVGSKC